MGATGTAADRDQLERLNREYIDAFLHADAAWFDRHLADDFVAIESDGSLLGKSAYVENARKGPDVATYELHQVDVRLHGDAALVQATGYWTRPDGTPGMSRYIDVYTRRADGWKVISAQVTRAARPAGTA